MSTIGDITVTLIFVVTILIAIIKRKKYSKNRKEVGSLITTITSLFSSGVILSQIFAQSFGFNLFPVELPADYVYITGTGATLLFLNSLFDLSSKLERDAH